MRRAVTGASVVLGLLLATPLALADTTVHLKNGDVASGATVEIARGDHVTLKLATGDLRTYAWTDIESVTDDAVKPPVPAPVVIAPPAAPAGVLVHLDADDPHALLATSSGFGEGSSSEVMVQIEEYKAFCMVPCDKSVPPGVYRIVGKDLAPTDDFTIPEGAHSVRLDATMHGRSRRGWGRNLVLTGAAFTGAGIMSLLLPMFLESHDNMVYLAAGGGMLAAGVALLAGGIYLMATTSSTVDVQTSQNGVGRFLTHGMQLSF